jgi:hypothetical protein
MPNKQIPMAEQAATSPSDKFNRSTTPKNNPRNSFHLFPKLPAEIQAMIWKENLPQRDECRHFRVVESKEKPRSISLVSITKYPPISIVCRTARNLAISHLPIDLPSVTGHPIRIHPRTTVCLKFDERRKDAGFDVMVHSFKKGIIPPFMVNIHHLEFHLWCFGSFPAPDAQILRRIIQACPNLTSITALKPRAKLLRDSRSNIRSFAVFAGIQEDIKRFSAVKPKFWLHGVALKVEIEGVGEDGEDILTDAVDGVWEQLTEDEARIIDRHIALSGTDDPFLQQ